MRRVVISMLFAATCVSAAWGVEPTNRKSNPQARAVLEYFYSLSGKTNNRILSGQFTNFGAGSNLKIMEHGEQPVRQGDAQRSCCGQSGRTAQVQLASIRSGR